jgi:hypothetical protein
MLSSAQNISKRLKFPIKDTKSFNDQIQSSQIQVGSEQMSKSEAAQYLEQIIPCNNQDEFIRKAAHLYDKIAKERKSDEIVKRSTTEKPPTIPNNLLNKSHEPSRPGVTFKKI